MSVSETIGSSDGSSGGSSGGSVGWETAAGLTPYEEALSRMEQRAAAIAAGTADELVWLVEHPPVLTAGTSARDVDLVDAAGVAVHRTGRGGQWTYHGPGQRVAYVMLDLKRRHGSVPARDVRAYVRGLEAWLIAVLGAFGVRGETREGRVGIWVADPATGAESKVAAIGVRVTRWASWHGVALNVAPDLSAFGRIVPCGIAEHGVTSLAALGVGVGLAEVDAVMRGHWAKVF